MGKNLHQIIVQDYVKEYPQMIQIFIYHKPYLQYETNHKKPTKQQTTEQSIHRSVRRTRSTISDIVLCNKFDMWCTFTFDKLKHDRYDIAHCKSTMNLWLHRQQVRSDDFSYLIVPELHKDGALHFHALLRGYNGPLRATKQRTKTNKLTIHKITGYRAGNAQAVILDGNYDAIIGYLQKYIQKDMPLLHGKKRFWSSQSLNKPTITQNGIFKFNLQNIIRNHPHYTVNSQYEKQIHKKGNNIPLTRYFLSLIHI